MAESVVASASRLRRLRAAAVKRNLYNKSRHACVEDSLNISLTTIAGMLIEIRTFLDHVSVQVPIVISQPFIDPQTPQGPDMETNDSGNNAYFKELAESLTLACATELLDSLKGVWESIEMNDCQR